MKLTEYCLDIFNDKENQIRNGTTCSTENISRMLEIIRKTLIEGLDQNTKNMIQPIEKLRKSADGGFVKTNPADIIALAFEVTVEQNNNPMLWRTDGDGGIHGEIKSVLRTIFQGPNQLTNDPKNGVHETNYKDAKIKLIDLLNKRYSLFR